MDEWKANMKKQIQILLVAELAMHFISSKTFVDTPSIDSKNCRTAPHESGSLSLLLTETGLVGDAIRIALCLLLIV